MSTSERRRNLSFRTHLKPIDVNTNGVKHNAVCRSSVWKTVERCSHVIEHLGYDTVAAHDGVKRGVHESIQRSEDLRSGIPIVVRIAKLHVSMKESCTDWKRERAGER